MTINFNSLNKTKKDKRKSQFIILELPWDQPSFGCKEYLAWKENKYTLLTPWSKLDTLLLSLIRKILTPNPDKRMTLDKVKLHKWCQSQMSTTPGMEILFQFA
jgi:serine/threonine protein kinase